MSMARRWVVRDRVWRRVCRCGRPLLAAGGQNIPPRQDHQIFWKYRDNFWPSPTRLATHTPVMSDFRPHDQESAWEFIGIGAAVFVFAIVALGWRTALRWCGDCALDRRARRERLQEEEALRLTRTLLPTHGDESYGSSSNATVIELVVDGGTPTSAPTHGDTVTTTNDEDHPVVLTNTGAINGR